MSRHPQRVDKRGHRGLGFIVETQYAGDEMSAPPTKAHKAAASLDEPSVEEWDAYIEETWRRLLRAYVNRRLRAGEEKNRTVPFPPPPLPPDEIDEFISFKARAMGSASQVALQRVDELMDVYQSDPRSPFHNIKYATKKSYESLLRRLRTEYGDRYLAALQASDFKQDHERWAEGGRYAIAHALITMMRMLFSFGATVLNDPECQRLAAIMHNLRFAALKKRSERLTADQIVQFRAQANKLGLGSLALAQAIQHDCRLGQKDCIGEWVPSSEPGESSYPHHEGKKWLGGLRWNEVGQDWVLRIGKRNFVLRAAPMVREELAIQYPHGLPNDGPMIVSETTHRPWTSPEFRRKWREIADACGIPPEVKNMDTRTRVRDEKRQSDDEEEPQEMAGDSAEEFGLGRERVH
jgi:hypothetical protein